MAKEYGVTLGLYAENLSDLYDTGEEAGRGWQQEFGAGRHRQDRQGNPGQCRHRPPRPLLKDGDRTFGYPSIVNLNRFAKGDSRLQTAYAAMFTEKYGSIIVMENMTYAEALPLYGLRQNIFTDPQKPMKVEAKHLSPEWRRREQRLCPHCRLRPDLFPGLRRDGAEQLPCEPADFRCLRHVRPDRLGRR